MTIEKTLPIQNNEKAFCLDLSPNQIKMDNAPYYAAIQSLNNALDAVIKDNQAISNQIQILKIENIPQYYSFSRETKHRP